jgi:hypothetical protein
LEFFFNERFKRTEFESSFVSSAVQQLLKHMTCYIQPLEKVLYEWHKCTGDFEDLKTGTRPWKTKIFVDSHSQEHFGFWLFILSTVWLCIRYFPSPGQTVSPQNYTGVI